MLIFFIFLTFLCLIGFGFSVFMWGKAIEGWSRAIDEWEKAIDMLEKCDCGPKWAA